MKVLFLIPCYILFVTCCRSSNVQPDNDLTTSQEKLRSVMNNGLSEAAKQPISLIGELRRTAAEYGMETADTTNRIDQLFLQQLDSAVLRLASTLFMQTDPQKIVTALNTMVFDTWGITFDADRNSVSTLFPHCIFQNKKGSCVGITLLYLLLAEKLGIPIYGVRAPGHFFCRYDNGSTRINIEPLKRGACMNDAWYRYKFHIADTTIYPLRNASIGEVSGVVDYNLGTIALNRKKYPQAQRYLDRAVAYIDTFPEAQGNLAIVLDATGMSLQALSLLKNVREIYPQLENIDQNLALVQLRSSHYNEALASFTKLLEKTDDNASFYYGKGVALYHLARNAEAVAALKQALYFNSDLNEAQKLLGAIEEAD